MGQQTNRSWQSQGKREMRYGRREAVVDGLHCRIASLQPSTADGERHSIEAVLVTEAAVPMYDYREGRMFDEVLLATGGRWRNHVPMLDSHYRFSSRETLGSVHDRKRVGFEWHGRLDFVRGDNEVDKVWLRVQQGHLRGVSAGYQYEASDAVRIPPGQTQVIDGRSWTAGDRELRVVRKWTGHEVSVTPIQADEHSHTRSDEKNRPVAAQVEDELRASETAERGLPATFGRTANTPATLGDGSVPPELLEFLRSIGLSPTASTAEAQAFYQSLQGAQRQQADALISRSHNPQPQFSSNTPPASTVPSGATSQAGPPPYPVIDSRSQVQPPVQQPAPGYYPQAPAAPGVVYRQQAYPQPGYTWTPPMLSEQQQGEANERERVLTIQSLGRGVDPHLVNRAIAEGWTIAQAREQFAPVFFQRSEPAQTGENHGQVRSDTPPTLASERYYQSSRGTALPTGTPGNPGQAPSARFEQSQSPTLQTLQAALIHRSAPHLLNDLRRGEFLQDNDVRQALSRSRGEWLGQWNRAMLLGGQVPNDLQEAARAVDSAWQYRDWHVMDFMRECCRLAGVPVPANRNDLFQRAIGTAEATALFTTNFQVQMLSGFNTVQDTTRGWVYEDDVANWQAKEYVQKGQVSKLRRKARTAAPDQATFETSKEELRVHTYAERWDMTREDAFDDRLGGLSGTPQEMGEAAGELRPDLVYGYLAANGNLSNGNPMFQTAGADIDNLTSGMAIDEASFQTVETKMTTQTNNGRPISCMPEYVIMAKSKTYAATRLLGSQETRNTTASTREGTLNPVRGRFTPVFEQRLDTGFVYPLSEAAVAAAPGTWYMAEPGSRQKGMAVVYLRADGRQPITDTYSLTEGRIGMGWSINMVIGVGAIGRSGIAKATT